MRPFAKIFVGGIQYPAIGQAWRRAWEHVVPLFAFPPAIRKMIYTTNAVESLNRSLRKVIKTRGSFPTDDANLSAACQSAAAHPAFARSVFRAGNSASRPKERT